MSRTISVISDELDRSVYGNKAYWLSWLHQNGFSVPYAISMPTTKHFEGLHQFEMDQVALCDLLAPMLADGLYEVAVRSSATCEDAQDASLAGHFQTIIGTMTIDEVVSSIGQVVTSLGLAELSDGCQMGVIVQKRILSEYSGVVFSSNPVTGEIGQTLISVIPGMGVELVSGHKTGEDIVVVSSNGEPLIPFYVTPIHRDNIRELWHIASQIEQTLAYPVDIEWCTEQISGHLYILQCRPATGILRREHLVTPVSLANESLIPSTVLTNKKVSIRLRAEKIGVNISRANLVYLNRTVDSVYVPPLGSLIPSPLCKGYSIVLIHPQTIQGKVVREFSRCDLLEDNLEKLGTVARDSHWMSIAIVQEIFDPLYTGIVKRIGDGYVVELAFGHFVPKGTVATSQYITNTEGVVNYSKEIRQERYLKIIDGEVLEVEVSQEDLLVSLPQNQIRDIVVSFSAFLDSDNVSIEFGIARTADRENFIYLIDLIEETEGSAMDSRMILEGVVSRGRITGKTVSYSPDPTKAKLDIHFHDNLDADPSDDNYKIFLYERPDISLIDIIRTHNPRNIGFVFREASVLCHLAIMLREKGIPAIYTEAYEDLGPDRTLTIDAISAGLSGIERVIYYD